MPNSPLVVVVVGKFEEETLAETIGQTFGTLSGGGAPSRLRISQENRPWRKVEQRKDLEQAYIALGLRVPGHPHKDMFKLLLLRGILAGGMSSRLFRELRDKRGIGYLAGSDLESFGKIGSISFVVSVNDPARIKETEGVIKAEFRDLRMNQVSNNELERAKNLAIRRYNSSLEESEVRATQLIMHELQDIPYDYRRLDYYINRLSARSIQETARKYLTDDYTLVALVPKGVKPF